jgi:hypothetical protein
MFRFKQVLIVILIAGFLAACLKQEDETASGPKARVAIINAALDSKPLTLLLDGEKVNESPLSFGTSSGTSDDAYVPARPGVRITFFQSGTNEPQEEKFLPWDPGVHYSVIQYDTSKNDVAPVVIVKDDPQPNDSLAKIRVINLVAGNGLLSVFLISSKNDTLKVTEQQPYYGLGGDISPTFNVSIKPGDYKLDLIDEQGIILQTDSVTLTEKLLYTWIEVGETGGTGDKQPHLLKIRQIK